MWEESPDAEVRAKLDEILKRTSSLGHSSSLVSVEITDSIDSERLTEWRPGAQRGARLRIPYPGRLDELIQRHRRFEETGAKIFRPNLGRTTVYSAEQKRGEEPAAGAFEHMILLKRSAGPRASLRSTLSLTAALRGAVMKEAPQPVPEFISGHAAGSTLENPIPATRAHVAFVPLANIGHAYADGDVMGVAVVLPRDLTRAQRAVCWATAERIEKLTTQWGDWDVVLADAEEQRRTLLPDTWMKPGRVWATVTPFVFDRFPKDPYGSEAEATVRMAFARAGFPEPRELDLHYNPWHTGVPKASLFPPAPARPRKPQRYHCHVRAAFERPIAGPVLAGAGRFYGYGLFRLLEEK